MDKLQLHAGGKDAHLATLKREWRKKVNRLRASEDLSESERESQIADVTHEYKIAIAQVTENLY